MMVDEQTAPAEPIAAPADAPEPAAPAEKAIVLIETAEINRQWFPQGKVLRLPAPLADSLIPAKARLASASDLRVAGLA